MNAWIPSLTLIDQVVLLGVAVVLPLALGGHRWWWRAAGAGVLGSFLVPRGWAGVLVAPFLVAAAASFLSAARAAGPLYFWTRRDVIATVASAYAVVAAGAFAQSRFGLETMGIHEPIVELTAVHYIFAGTAALVLAEAARSEADGGLARVGTAAVLCTAAAPPIVAVGFVTGGALPQVGGAVLMTVGVWLTASLQLHGALAVRQPIRRALLLGISGLAVWVPMVLAVAWAAGQHWDIPVLSIRDMARTHGLTNAIAFVLCGLLARRLPVPATSDDRVPVPA